MRFKTKTSLHTALWLVIAIATVPALLLAFFDYQQSRRDALLNVTDDAQTMLTMARSSEQAAVREVQQLLRIMAGANEMQSADPVACNQLAQRLIKSNAHISSMGAVTPEGLVFCSARTFSGMVNVADRQWFKNALISRDFAPGQFLVGRISGQPGITFGYALRHPDGTPKTLFFAASQPASLAGSTG